MYIYEQRTRLVKENELELWNQVTPFMMSEEEDKGENTFKVRTPERRSEELDSLLSKLDARANSKHTNKAHPR